MSRLFKPGFRLTAAIGNPSASPGSWFQTVQDTLTITGMKVQVDIEKSLAKSPNRAKITIFNLSEHTRKAIETAKPLNITLECGYDGQLETIFRGDAELAESVHDKTDWLTTVESGDGLRAYANASISLPMGEGVTGQQIITSLAGNFGLKVPTNVAAAKDFLKMVAGGGPVALQGKTEAEMTRLLAPMGYQWSIQNGQLVILGPNDTSLDDALVVSQDTGMIGVPHFDLPKTPGKPAILKCKMQMTAAANPGRRLLMQSAAIEGLFRIERVKHVGDSDNRWETDITARML